MMQLPEVNAAAKIAAQAKLPAGMQVLRAESKAVSDAEGKEALRVLLVLDDAAGQRDLGDAALSVIVAVLDALQQRGETRFPIIEFATNAELQADADPES
ncbi:MULTISPECIES: hypothetical protein [Roseomonadaceae]|uniref:Uncharacterized protein n=1 Tax=Falsiroseomonas oleicola TaxID=2801474 RepID=A0ABS6H8T4_9PROT|nr:hypothetical protein [Roseomonas oleicola]MBU8545122.1 hypothetical protein [Roseomonas oleicola]